MVNIWFALLFVLALAKSTKTLVEENLGVTVSNGKAFIPIYDRGRLSLYFNTSQFGDMQTCRPNPVYLSLYDENKDSGIKQEDEPDGVFVGEATKIHNIPFTFVMKAARDAPAENDLPDERLYLEVVAESQRTKKKVYGDFLTPVANFMIHYHYPNSTVRAQVSHPGQVALTKKNPQMAMDLHYNCSALEEFASTYHDDVIVSLNDGKDTVVQYELKVVCTPSEAYKPDLNMTLLFVLAIGIVFVAFHTPELRIVLEMSDEEMQETEIKTSQAFIFFFGASAMLFTLYLLLDYIAGIFELVITFVSAMAVQTLVEELICHKFGDRIFKRTGTYKDLPKIKFIWTTTNWLEIVTMAFGLIVAALWYFTRNWILNNILGVSICLLFLKIVRLNKLVPGVLLLGLLFFYDIFWVFYSPKFTKGGQSVMMAVATKFDAPIKLLMPHILRQDNPTTQCSLIGLGDIVIPGVFIGFLIRFGRFISKYEFRGDIVLRDRPVTIMAYRNASLICYGLALFTCGGFLWIYHSAQPALLYIVPFLFIAAFGVGIFRKEMSELVRGIDVELELRGNKKKNQLEEIEYELQNQSVAEHTNTTAINEDDFV